MQTSLMFLDLTARGAKPNIQKVAIKMPDSQLGPEESEYSQFSEVISALMALTPEKLEASLDQMDWIKIEGGLSEYAPLIDLSGGNENHSRVWRELLEQIGPEINPLNIPTALTGGSNASWDNQTIEQIKSAIETIQEEGFSMAENAVVGKEPWAAQTAERGPWAMPTSDKSDLELLSKGGGKKISLENSKLGKDGEDSKQQALGNQHPKWNPDNRLHQQLKQVGEDKSSSHLSRQQLADIQSKIQSDSEFKPSRSETQSIKETSVDILKQGQTEGLNLKTGDSRPPIKIESADKGHQETAPAQSLGRQLAQNDQQEAETFTRQEAKEHVKFNLQSSHHKPEQLEIFTDIADDAAEAPLHGRHIQRDTLNPAVHKTSIGDDRGIDHLSGKSEWTPPAGEIQSNVIRQIVQRMSLRTLGSQSTMSIKLKPEFLGNLHMQVSTDNQHVVVRMAAESVAVKEMIEQGLQYLKTELHHHGLEIDKFDVFVANDNGGTNHDQDTAAFQQALKQRRQGKMGHFNNSSDESDQTVAGQQSTDASSEIDYFA